MAGQCLTGAFFCSMAGASSLKYANDVCFDFIAPSEWSINCVPEATGVTSVVTFRKGVMNENVFYKFLS